MTATTTVPLASAAELRARRLIAQLLAPSAARPSPASPSGNVLADVASWMTAVQAQNAAAGRDALALRAGQGPGTVSPVDLADAGIVRSWSQRGTHHLLPARDVRWITRLCSPRVLRASAKRRGQIGLTDADVDRCRDALCTALADRGALTRPECYAVFRDAGTDPDGGRGPHMLRHFGGEGDIVQGTPRGATETFVLHDAVVTGPVDLTGQDALRELAVRYIRSRGPVTPGDLAWWTGLTLTDARKAVTLAAETGTVVAAQRTDTAGSVGSTGKAGAAGPSPTFWLADWQADVSPTELADAVSPDRPTLALPAFDEYLMAYTDRSDVITPEVTAQVGPTKNGLVRPFLVAEGRVTGPAAAPR